jgi:hypothetical protein
MEASGQLGVPVTINPEERAPGANWIGGWLGPRVGLDVVEKRKILSNPGRAAHSPSLYRPTYADAQVHFNYNYSIVYLAQIYDVSHIPIYGSIMNVSNRAVVRSL